MSESQQPHINDPSTPAPDAVPPSSGQTARDGAEPSPASQSEPPDLPYAMETVRVDPRDLERMRRGGQPQASLPVPPAQSAGPSAPEKPTVSGPEDPNAGRARETAADAPTSPGSEADDMPDAAAETVILPSGRPGPNATVGQPASEAGPAGRGRMPRHPGSGPGTADPGTSAGAAGARPVGDAYGRPGPTAPEASATTWPAPGTIGADPHGGTAGPAVAGRPPTVGPRDAGAPATGANRPDAAAPTGQAPPVSSIPTVSGPPPASRSSSATRPGTPSPAPWAPRLLRGPALPTHRPGEHPASSSRRRRSVRARRRDQCRAPGPSRLPPGRVRRPAAPCRSGRLRRWPFPGTATVRVLNRRLRRSTQRPLLVVPTSRCPRDRCRAPGPRRPPPGRLRPIPRQGRLPPGRLQPAVVRGRSGTVLTRLALTPTLTRRPGTAQATTPSKPPRLRPSSPVRPPQSRPRRLPGLRRLRLPSPGNRSAAGW